jgi:DNA-binding CsgD family transcriptional regulator
MLLGRAPHRMAWGPGWLRPSGFRWSSQLPARISGADLGRDNDQQHPRRRRALPAGWARAPPAWLFRLHRGPGQGLPREGRQAGDALTAAAEEYFEAGQWDDALAELEPAAGLRGRGDIPVRAHGLIALIAGHRDEPGRAEEHLAAARDRAPRSIRRRASSSYLLRARALAAERAGRADEAVRVLAPYLDPRAAADMRDRNLLLPLLARLALAAGDAATAVAAAQAAATEAARGSLPVQAAAASYCAGLVAGDPAPVLAAAGYYQSAGRPFDRAQALEDAAVLLARRGDLPAARRAFEDAAGLYQALGAAWDLRRADSRLLGYGIRRGRRGRSAKPAHGWDALTPTERKIAYLVAGGRSNPEIAAELFLSRNTVQTHVSHILAKLGARSRAEIILQAVARPRPADGKQP